MNKKINSSLMIKALSEWLKAFNNQMIMPIKRTKDTFLNKAFSIDRPNLSPLITTTILKIIIIRKISMKNPPIL